MSQDSQICEECKKPCGYDDDKILLDPGYMCSQCAGNLMNRFWAFFGISGGSWDEFAIEVDWKDVVRILNNIKRDYDMRVSYIITDKDLYEKTIKILTPIDKK